MTAKKPRWAQRFAEQAKIEQEARAARLQAVTEMRCRAEESGGARCTADAEPEHRHRYSRDDLPETVVEYL